MNLSSLRLSVGLGAILAIVLLGSVYAAFLPTGDDRRNAENGIGRGPPRRRLERIAIGEHRDLGRKIREMIREGKSGADLRGKPRRSAPDFP